MVDSMLALHQLIIALMLMKRLPDSQWYALNGNQLCWESAAESSDFRSFLFKRKAAVHRSSRRFCSMSLLFSRRGVAVAPDFHGVSPEEPGPLKVGMVGDGGKRQVVGTAPKNRHLLMRQFLVSQVMSLPMR